MLSRLAALVDQYDGEFTGEKRLSLLKGVAGYLKIYYKGRAELPNDESNGNTPLVSAYEVAWYSWRVFDEMFRLTGENRCREYRDQVRRLIEQERSRTTSTSATRRSPSLRLTAPLTPTASSATPSASSRCSVTTANGRCCLKRQPVGRVSNLSLPLRARPSRLLSRTSPDREVARVHLERQQEWGGWFDPKQTYENFRTPFRETQFAVMALSEFYKGTDGKGWLAKAPQSLSAGDALLRLQQIDGVWERPSLQLTRKPGRKSRQRRADGADGRGCGAGASARKRRRRNCGVCSAIRANSFRCSRATLRRIASRFVVPPSGGMSRDRARSA